MTDFFPAALATVLDIEQNGAPADDPGGATWKGLARNSHPTETPWPPSDQRVAEIYRQQYWDAQRCGEMPWPWALAVFDGYVNQGGSAVYVAQQALGVKADGAVGSGTLAAVAKSTPENFHMYLALRAWLYAHAAQFPQDGKGWFKRTIQIAMAAAVPPTGE